MAELNFNAELYRPLQPDETITDYALWLEICKRMDMEVAIAKAEWRQAVAERDQLLSEMKERTSALRNCYMQLETRIKPIRPKV